MNISKELLTELRTWWVSNKYQDKEENLHRDIQADIREQWDGNDYCNGFSDNDLANIAKQWALTKNHRLSSYIYTSGSLSCAVCLSLDKFNTSGGYWEWYGASEAEAITVAAQWIFKNEDQL